MVDALIILQLPNKPIYNSFHSASLFILRDDILPISPRASDKHHICPLCLYHANVTSKGKCDFHFSEMPSYKIAAVH
jgi:hypothetical protein